MPGEITQEPFGQTKDGKDVTRYTLRNSKGTLVVCIIDFGASINDIKVPDHNGKMTDISMGYDDVAGYESGELYFGGIIGRVANRIAGGQFTLDGQVHQLSANDGGLNALHGGYSGFNKKLWSGKVDGDKLVLQYVSPDGDEHYPGEVTLTVTFNVTDDCELCLEYAATTTKPTPLNVTSHPYFNLAGHNTNTLKDHHVTIHADAYLPVDENGVPTGELRNVEGTDYDLRKPVEMGERMSRMPGGKGFDNTYSLRASDGTLRLVAKVEHPPTGRFLECRTTEPGLNFYTSFFVDVPNGGGKGGTGYKQYSGMCLEAMHYADSVHQPSFPNTILRPGETYRQTTIYKFGVA